MCEHTFAHLTTAVAGTVVRDSTRSGTIALTNSREVVPDASIPARARLALLAASLVAALPPRRGRGRPSGPVLLPFSFDPAHPYCGGPASRHRRRRRSRDETVLAPAAGVVTFAGTVPGSGKSVTILTSDGWSVTLTQLGSIAVAKGATVAEGDGVGTIGPSGDAEVSGPYVQLGIRHADQDQGYVDPQTLLPPRSQAAGLAPTVSGGAVAAALGACVRPGEHHAGRRRLRLRPIRLPLRPPTRAGGCRSRRGRAAPQPSVAAPAPDAAPAPAVAEPAAAPTAAASAGRSATDLQRLRRRRRRCRSACPRRTAAPACCGARAAPSCRRSRPRLLPRRCRRDETALTEPTTVARPRRRSRRSLPSRCRRHASSVPHPRVATTAEPLSGALVRAAVRRPLRDRRATGALAAAAASRPARRRRRRAARVGSPSAAYGRVAGVPIGAPASDARAARRGPSALLRWLAAVVPALALACCSRCAAGG